MALYISGTLDDLEQIINNDNTNHQIKELGILLMAAMKDWPGINCNQFQTFCEEIKAFYGDPVTLENIENKHLNRNNEIDLWKHEAGAAVAEMIEFSKRHYNEESFDKIIERILNN